jgi:hypothetical protein
LSFSFFLDFPIALSDDPLSRAFLGELCAKTGQKDKAREVLAGLHRSPGDTYAFPRTTTF